MSVCLSVCQSVCLPVCLSVLIDDDEQSHYNLFIPVVKNRGFYGQTDQYQKSNNNNDSKNDKNDNTIEILL